MRPRYGVGRQERRVGLDQHPVQRRHPERLAERLGVLERHRAGEAQVGAAVEAGRGRSRRRRRSSASPTARARPPRRAPAARRRGRPGRGSPASCPAAWPGRCAAGTTRPAPPGRPRRCGSGRARSPPPPAPCRAPAPASRSRPCAASRSASRGASLGCSATPATSASYVAAASTAHRAPPQVAADLHDPGHADGGGRGERLVDRRRGVAVRGDVEVAVVVDDRVRQRLRCRRSALGRLDRGTASIRSRIALGAAPPAPRSGSSG